MRREFIVVIFVIVLAFSLSACRGNKDMNKSFTTELQVPQESKEAEVIESTLDTKSEKVKLTIQEQCQIDFAKIDKGIMENAIKNIYREAAYNCLSKHDLSSINSVAGVSSNFEYTNDSSQKNSGLNIYLELDYGQFTIEDCTIVSSYFPETLNSDNLSFDGEMYITYKILYSMGNIQYARLQKAKFEYTMTYYEEEPSGTIDAFNCSRISFLGENETDGKSKVNLDKSEELIAVEEESKKAFESISKSDIDEAIMTIYTSAVTYYIKNGIQPNNSSLDWVSGDFRIADNSDSDNNILNFYASNYSKDFYIRYKELLSSSIVGLNKDKMSFDGEIYFSFDLYRESDYRTSKEKAKLNYTMTYYPEEVSMSNIKSFRCSSISFEGYNETD